MIGIKLGMNLGSNVPTLLQQALSAIRRLGGTALYVPDNYAGAFIDSTGTQPVTAVNDLVGLLTDRSYGASNLGGDIFGGFTGGTVNTGSSIVGGSLVMTSAPGGYAVFIDGKPLLSNKTYRFTVTYTGVTGNCGVLFQGATASQLINGTGTSSYIINSGTVTNARIQVNNNSGSGVNGTISLAVQEVLGNHATQGTTAAKPLVTQLANGTKVMDFDASNDSLTIGMVTGGTPWVRTYTTAGTVTTYTSATTTQIVMGQPQLAGRRVVLMVASNAAITGADLTTIERFAVSRGAVL